MTTKNALLSVYDKTGTIELARALIELGWTLYSSGGTADALAAAGISVTYVEELTGYPSMLGGRVKTLHPMVHGGILADLSDPEQVAEVEQYQLHPFGLVVTNLYPFSATVASGASYAECIEKIDVGGPTMVRAAAKNHAHVGVVTDPADYDKVLEELRTNGELSAETRLELAKRAFAHTAAYDLAVVEWLSDGEYVGVLGQKVQDCDYGENRWQSPAALYRLVGNEDPLAVHQFQLVAGRPPSYINWTDVDRQLQTVTHLVAEHEINFGDHPYVAVAVKHGNPCGASAADTPEEALKLMLTGDTRAVYGAVLMVNFPITGELVEILQRYASKGKRLLDGLCAPAFDAVALATPLRQDGKFFLATNPLLAELTAGSLDQDKLIRMVRGGFLVQPNYTNVIDLKEAEVNGEVTEQKRRDTATGIAICATSNSNTVTGVKGGQLVANGVGQQDRVGCCELLVHKAAQNGHDLHGAVMVSDSFFPFPDGPEILINAGAAAIFSTTGSNRDSETQKLCQERGVTLIQMPDADTRMFSRH